VLVLTLLRSVANHSSRRTYIGSGHSTPGVPPMRSCLLALLMIAAPLRAADDYKLGPDSMSHDDVPKGKVEKFSWASKVFPGTVRDYWVYRPAQYDAKMPTCFMVFQDGGTYVNTGEKAQFHAPIVFDNLIHQKKIPVMIGIFINPGVVPPAQAGRQGRPNRS